MTDYLQANPNAPWISRITEIEREDPVLGGTGGPVNVPHQELAYRTEYLKTNLDIVTATLNNAIANLSVGNLHAQVAALEITVQQILSALSGQENAGQVVNEGLLALLAQINELRDLINALGVSGEGNEVPEISMFSYINHCS